jgi:uncharacterized OB-fold protein
MTMFSSRNWREYPQRYRLEAVKFKKSGKTYYPPRAVDPETGDTEHEKVVLPDEGKVVTYTVIRVAPSQWGDMSPYALAIETEDHHGVLSYGHKFVPKWF